MRVLFITHNGISHEPLGLEYVSGALLANGHETKACWANQAFKTIEEWSPDFVAFQVLTGDQDRWGNLGIEIKKRFPRIKTIYGGPHYLFFAQATQEGADFIIKGDGEKAIVDCVEGRPYVQMQAATNIDTLAVPDRDLLYNDNYPGIKHNSIRNFIAVRGCPYKCTYCYNSNENWLKMVAGEKRLRYHGPEWIVNEIERTMKNYGGELVSFQDDIFGVDMQWLEEFVKHYKRLKYPFFAQLRPHLIKEDRVKLLREAGIHIASFAIESGNEQTRKVVLDRQEPNKVIEEGTAVLHKYGIKFRMQNMLGLPVEDPLSDALETLRFNMKCKPTLSWCSLLQAYPGTKIADYVIKIGLAKDEADLMSKVDATFFDEGSLPIKDKVKIERLQKYWSAVVRWQWLYPIVKILINFNLGRRIHTWIFETSKWYINKKEYWRVTEGNFKAREVKSKNEFQFLDRLGGELDRKEVLKDCVA